MVQKVSMPNAVAFTSVPIGQHVPDMGPYSTDPTQSVLQPSESGIDPKMTQSSAILNSYFFVPMKPEQSASSKSMRWEEQPEAEGFFASSSNNGFSNQMISRNAERYFLIFLALMVADVL